MEVELQAILISTLEEKNDLQVPAVLFLYILIRRLPESQYLKANTSSAVKLGPFTRSPVPLSSQSTDLPRSLDWSEKE
jgi:hypothetical protein